MLNHILRKPYGLTEVPGISLSSESDWLVNDKYRVGSAVRLGHVR